MAVSSILMVCLVVMMLLIAAFALVFYIFKGVGMFAISRRRKLGASALAWIPVLSMFKLGQIADDAVQKKRGRRSHFVALYPIFCIAGGVLSLVSTFLTMLAVRFSPELVDAFFQGDYEIIQRHAEIAVSDPVFYIGLAIAALGYILVIIGYVFLYMSLFHIYKSCSGKYIVLFVLTLVFPFLYPIFLLAIRRNDHLVWYPTGNTPWKPYPSEPVQAEPFQPEPSQQEPVQPEPETVEEGGTTYHYDQENRES